MCRWQLLLERGLDVVGHLQLDFTASCANGSRLGPMALAPGLRGGASVVSALAASSEGLLLEQKAAMMKTISASLQRQRELARAEMSR